MKISIITLVLVWNLAAPAFADDCDKESLRFGTLMSIGAEECDSDILRERAHAINQSHAIGHCSEIQIYAEVVGALEGVPKSISRFGREGFCNGLDAYMTRVEDTGLLESP